MPMENFLARVSLIEDRDFTSRRIDANTPRACTFHLYGIIQCCLTIGWSITNTWISV